MTLTVLSTEDSTQGVSTEDSTLSLLRCQGVLSTEDSTFTAAMSLCT